MKRVSEAYDMIDTQPLAHKAIPELRAYASGHLTAYWGKLYSCACVVKTNISGKINYFEEVHATSLNHLYKSTYVHYFGNFGNPACNALDRFYEDHKNENSNLMEHRYFNP